MDSSVDVGWLAAAWNCLRNRWCEVAIEPNISFTTFPVSIACRVPTTRECAYPMCQVQASPILLSSEKTKGGENNTKQSMISLYTSRRKIVHLFVTNNNTRRPDMHTTIPAYGSTLYPSSNLTPTPLISLSFCFDSCSSTLATPAMPSNKTSPSPSLYTLSFSTHQY